HEALLARVPIPEAQVYRMRGEDEPQHAARDYEKILSEKFDENPPRFDLILLGMGEDGHTASLFPDSPALDEFEHLVAAPFVEKLKANRLTMTPRTINAAHSVTFLVAGDAKAATLRAVLEGERDTRRYPSQLVNPAEGELVWLVDEAAASALSL
ncbi:MAG: 6-phosphogluconolactonase, partial [Acidobacteria bacterium]|nr:6-phosphogluconolactonase [Acidobacteriota bacterium]